MMLILLFDTAIRVSELVSITLGDILIDTENPVILIHGKGRKERAIAVSDRAATHLKAYITAYHVDLRFPITTFLKVILSCFSLYFLCFISNSTLFFTAFAFYYILGFPLY